MPTAVPTSPLHGEVVGVDCEPVLPEGLCRQRREEPIADFEHRSALFADEMAVCCRGEVIGRGAMSQVDVGDDSEPLKLLEVAVDGREVDVGCFELDLGDEILGCPVAGRGEKRPQKQPPGCRRPSSGRPKAFDDARDGFVDCCVRRAGVFRLGRWARAGQAGSSVGHRLFSPVQVRRVADVTTPRVRDVCPATRTAWGPGTVPGVWGIHASGSAVMSRTVRGMLRVAMSATDTDSKMERMCSRTAIHTSTSGSAEPL